ncbi:MAG: HDIG domain-containing protein [Candidatus Omnitrophica bacterium]|nr:HDIG domain-containing protein [Candidatus Omnitrophota bacterium]MBU2044742.1 HDIG domain-containing protein [Candidatus Omnitrophota bacterium]MBU2250880.1 HDIG domain-containing protein [Candidatus Omnitrophota bacterium]MBU2473885.1 HDIG domain-containing protein [Candidatus Omnitrophota bacterium]
MKLSIAKKEISLDSLIIGITFFGIVGFVFFIYSIDFALLGLILILFVYARFIRKIDNLPNYLDLSILAAIGLLIPLLTIVTFRISGYGIMAIGFAMLVTLLFNNLELSLIFIIFITSLSSAIDGGNFNLRIALFIGALTAAMFTFRARRRFQIIRAGLIAGVIQFAVAFLMERQQSFFVLSGIDLNLLKLCLLNGVISSGVVLGFLPVFEYIFKVVTNVSLLELSDFNHPLLRRLILEAPGTYQHSLVVANLSEAAAEAIGANPLLARVGSYYHDVGKMLKPDYFVENLVSYRDVHKNLKPSMSKLIIFNHVKDGVDLANKYRLNPKIIDFISQHHGRTLVYYFYQRAKELEPEGMHEEEYRYPGPKPQIKETAIVALADTIEALSRTLEEPTPSRIEEMVREVVRKRFMEGELDECNLTLKDIEKIIQSFTRMLNAIFHTRINYPKDENRNNKPPKNKESKP